jgi:perosamine synthetase
MNQSTVNLMSKSIIEVALARTALKLGLTALGARPGQIILVPNFCCDVVFHPLVELNLKVITYKLKSDLTPDWDYLNAINTKNIFGIMMIHYFGQPQNIDKFSDYCVAHSIKLIEDNAHGFGGSYQGKNLGQFGDMGVSSPRKILGTPQGGLLFLKKASEEINLCSSLGTPPLRSQVINFMKLLISRFPPLYNYLVVQKLRKYNFSDPYAFKERVQPHGRVSAVEKLFFNLAKTDEIAKSRRKLWKEWEEYLTRRGLRAVFKKLDESSCPWAIPFYCDNIEQRNAWISWGLIRNLPLFCWPSLPDEQVQKEDCAFEKWSTIVCVPLNVSPPKYENIAQ